MRVVIIFAALDVRLSRQFKISEHCKLEVLADGFNLLNRANYAVPNNTFGSGAIPPLTFGQPTQAFDPRQFQFGMKSSF